jgi:hypothetical protein
VTGNVKAPGIDMTGLAPEPDFDDVEFEVIDDVMVFHKARLTSITLGEHPCWAGLTLSATGRQQA